MKKTSMIMVLIAALGFSISGMAQDVKGTNYLNLGIGLGTFGFTGTGGLPITASFEHGITDAISVGANLGYVQTNSGDWKFRYYIVGARGSYHFNELLNVQNEKVDLYGGAGIFYRGWKWTAPESNLYKTSGGGLDFALHAGARYMFANAIGGFAELGYGISPLQLGLTFRL